MKRLLLGVVVAVFFACEPISERKQPIPSLYQLSQMDLNLDGEKLAELYCANCHIKPNPDILDKETWEKKVLPDMRMRMGLYLAEDFGVTLPSDNGVPKGIYSDIPLIKRDDWEKLKNYYLEFAPDTPLPQEEKLTPQLGIPNFNVEIPEFDFLYPDLITMIQVDNQSNIWLGHRFKRLFQLKFNGKFELIDSLVTDVAPVSIHFDQSGFELLSMGLMDPSNDSLGTLEQFEKVGQQWEATRLKSKLMRPVDLAVGDLDGDGIEDRVISQFGNHLGKLSVYFTREDSEEEVVLKALPGARKVKLLDFDQDGDLDVFGMMTQAREGIYFWENTGDGRFSEKVLLEFQPAFGSSDFQLEDFDQDGLLDIVIVNGDNADLSQILKNFHGVRIFKNKGSFEFEESWFYPMYGASGVQVDDFDQDGDKDIVAISFFPDSKQSPRQDLIYFENLGDEQFQPFVTDLDIDANFLIIAKGDVDLDQDQDILVGAFDFNDLYKRASENWQPFILLRNKIF
ncbi:MAG: VCBS repeat-containing protein [Algoriphagus sp.]|uniref:FG-GAP repeat domain-containing protein n=1 Tax=Algoriphagus sp. TaxID=1872435 RepID=UPI001859A075|nr:VCBS repeat-containing protein [Algoriphagus sp.]NVJ84788.1 VCBS repeat-containing protein [Algoriphagus sp.]